MAGAIMPSLSDVAQHLNSPGNANWFHTMRPVQESELSETERQRLAQRREEIRARRRVE
jgi:hypothetical protein